MYGGVEIGVCNPVQHVMTLEMLFTHTHFTEQYTVNHKKTWHFIFDYNYDISWPIFTLFAANET